MRHAPAPILSRTGRRSENEDDVWLRSTTDSSGKSISVLAVADGMGGHTHGAKASEIAIRGVQDAIEDWMGASDSLDEDQLRIKCRQLFERIDQAIEIYTDEHPDAEGMGTTLVLGVVLGDQAYVAHIGDSRAYWVSPDETVDQLTLDHSAAAEAVREGRMTEAEVAGSAFQHALTRSLDGSGDSDPDFGVHSIDEPGFLVLCSDGLSGTIEDERLAQELLRKAPLAETTEALVDAAFEQGSEDNISLAVLECGAVERKESAAAVVPPPSESSSTGQPPADQPSSSEPAPEARPPEPPVRDPSPGRSTSTRSGAPRWATTLLGVLVVALLGLGGWAEYQHGLVGLLPAEPSSPPPSIAEAGDEASPSEDNPELPNDNSGDDGNGSELGGGSGSDGGQPDGNQAGDSGPENDQSGSDGERSSQRQAGGSDSQEQTDDSGLVGLEQNAADPAGEGGADGTPEGEEDASAGDRGQSGKNASGAGDEQDEGGFTTGSSAETEETLEAEAVAVVQEGESLEQMVPHDKFDPETHRIEMVEDTVKVRTEIELSSGALLTVEPEGRFTYDPNGAFRRLGAGEDTTDRFTYTAVSETDDQRIEGAVEIPIQGKNTPPSLQANQGLSVTVGESEPITAEELEATDPDDGAGELQFTVTEDPTRGEIRVGDGTDSASDTSSFMQRDIKKGRVFFYADTTGEAGEDDFTVAVKDEDGAGPGSESLRVKIEPAETQKTQNTSSDTEGECRIQFAAKNKKDASGELTPRDSTDLVEGKTADDLRSRGEEVTVRYAKTKRGVAYGLFSKQAGTESEMDAKLENMEDVPNGAFVHCFDR